METYDLNMRVLEMVLEMRQSRITELEQEVQRLRAELAQQQSDVSQEEQKLNRTVAKLRKLRALL